MLAYSGCDYGFGTASRCGLYRVSIWGGIPTQILDNPHDIPTDGGESGVLFMREVQGNWDVYLVGAGGGTPRRLTTHDALDGLATFSPDGRQTAFISNRSGAWAIWLMAGDGANQRKLVDLPDGGGYGADWTMERISWGPEPAQPTPVPTPLGGDLLPPPQLVFPIPEDTISPQRPTTVRWTWSQELASDQGFQIRFWHATDPSPLGATPPTGDLSFDVNFGLTEAYLRHGGQENYFLDVVVVRTDTLEVLSRSSPIPVRIDPDK
jgi:hypothetical protein